MIDKHYFVAPKLIAPLLEERYHRLGYDIVSNGVARRMALDLATEGSRALGRDGFDRLIATAVGVSKKNRTSDYATVGDLYTVIRESCAYTRRCRAPQARNAADVLELLRAARPEAEAFARQRTSDAIPDR